MWNQASSSKIIQDKLTEQSYQRHRKSLMNVRSALNTSSPSRPHFVFNKYKRRLSQHQRQYQIKSENVILVQKMISQKLGNYHRLTNPVFGKQSLNEVVAKKRNNQIVRDNMIIIKKLVDMKPTYSTRSIISDTNKHLCYMSNISQNARRAVNSREMDFLGGNSTSASTTRLGSERDRYSSVRRLRSRPESDD